MTNDDYKMVRVRRETFEQLVALKQRVQRLGIDGLPDALKMHVASLGDVVDLAVRAARKAVG